MDIQHKPLENLGTQGSPHYVDHWTGDCSGIPFLLPSVKQTPWTILIQRHQCPPTRKSKTSFKVNILTFTEGKNENVLRKHSKECLKC